MGNGDLMGFNGFNGILSSWRKMGIINGAKTTINGDAKWLLINGAKWVNNGE